MSLSLLGTPRTTRSGAYPTPKPPRPPKPKPQPPKARHSRRNPADAQLATGLTSFLHDFATAYVSAQTLKVRRKRAEIDLVNAAAEMVIGAFRAALKEAIREQPGRAQAGDLDRLIRAIGPIVRKELRA